MWLDELKKMKEQSKLTTKEISAISNIAEPTLEKIFSGATKDPKLTTMQTLVHSLGFTLDDLAPEQKEKTPAKQESYDNISLESTTQLLYGLGFINEGQQLSDDDLAFLVNILGLLDNWFSRKSIK